MPKPTRDELMIQLDRIDTALEAPDADRPALMQQAKDWLATQSEIEPGDALYYRERLDVIRERHGNG